MYTSKYRTCTEQKEENVLDIDNSYSENVSVGEKKEMLCISAVLNCDFSVSHLFLLNTASCYWCLHLKTTLKNVE